MGPSVCAARTRPVGRPAGGPTRPQPPPTHPLSDHRSSSRTIVPPTLHSLSLTPYPSPSTPHPSPFTRYPSFLTSYPSPLILYPLPFTPHSSPLYTLIPSRLLVSNNLQVHFNPHDIWFLRYTPVSQWYALTCQHASQHAKLSELELLE